MADASLFDHMTVSIFRIIQVTSLAVAGLALIGCAGPEGLLRTNEIASDNRGQPQEESSQNPTIVTPDAAAASFRFSVIFTVKSIAAQPLLYAIV